jgi:DNA-binding MarR family transcriptional regulator
MVSSENDPGRIVMPRPSRTKHSPRPPAPTLRTTQYHALAQFRRALRTFLAFSESATQNSGVTTQQYQALLAIKASPDESLLVRELAEAMLLKHNNTVQLVDRLVEAKFVRRTPSAEDRRAVVLTLTAKGEEKIAYLAAIHFRELAMRQEELTDILHLATRMERMK